MSISKFGILTLIPTPLSDEGVLEPKALELLLFASSESQRAQSRFVIEDLKPGRRRWLHFGLPRECVENFICYNEHTAKIVALELLKDLKLGNNVYLMSDGGLPAFYDPGIELVDLCHKNQVRVTSTPFFNSVSLALALSGFSHKKFWFEGFLPLEAQERQKALKSLLAMKSTSILMDTPYRLKRVLEELQSVFGNSKKSVFLAMDLNSNSEELKRGTPTELLLGLTELRREFVLVISE
jgi:16S rRNA (cytidine1402-2'-O)-methyltransferase